MEEEIEATKMREKVFTSKNNSKYLSHSKYYTKPSETGISVGDRLYYLGQFYTNKKETLKTQEEKEIKNQRARSPKTAKQYARLQK